MDDFEGDFLAIGNGELKGLPLVKDGYSFKCPHCFKEHQLRKADNSESTITQILFYNCGDKTYLGALNGKFIVSLLEERINKK